MSTLTDRLIALAAVTQKPRRVSSAHWAGAAMLAVMAAALVSGKVAQTGFANEVIARVSSDLQVLDQRWLNARKWFASRRNSTSGRVECISDYNPYWEARSIADRVESGSRVIVGCLQVRIASD
jgi:hypothetical protein